MKKIYSYILALLVSDGLFWGARLAASRVRIAVRSAFLSKLLNAKNFRISGELNIRGIRHIDIGANAFINGSAWIEAVLKYGDSVYNPSISIGSDVSFSDKVHITCVNKIVVGDGALFGSKVFVSDHDHGSYRGSKQSSPSEMPSKRELGIRGEVRIGKNVWIGENAVLIAPLFLGDGCVIGANSVVTGKFEANSMLAGAPAKVIKKFDPTLNEWKKTYE